MTGAMVDGLEMRVIRRIRRLRAYKMAMVVVRGQVPRGAEVDLAPAGVRVSGHFMFAKILIHHLDDKYVKPFGIIDASRSPFGITTGGSSQMRTAICYATTPVCKFVACLGRTRNATLRTLYIQREWRQGKVARM